jgi:hypothetical protein
MVAPVESPGHAVFDKRKRFASRVQPSGERGPQFKYIAFTTFLPASIGRLCVCMSMLTVFIIVDGFQLRVSLTPVLERRARDMHFRSRTCQGVHRTHAA